ncbi:MAG: hypothetical protein WCK28_17045 [Burkholderiales bacterium]
MFSLSNARAKVRNVNLRAEKHGDEEVPAVDVAFELDRPSTDLAMFGSQLRDSLFWCDPAHQAPGLLDEIDPNSQKPNLRNPMLKGPFKVDRAYVGCEVTIDYGLGGDSNIVLDPVKVNGVKVEPVEGGSVRLSLRVQASKVDEKTAGRLAMMIDRETSITVVAPERGEIDSEGGEE